MSYTMSLTSYKFIIPNKNIESATTALKAKMTYGNLRDDFYIKTVLHSRSIETLMKLCGFTILCNKNGYVDISVDKNCYYDYTKSVFETIMPYMSDDSWFEWVGEDSDRFKWIIKNGKFTEVKPKLSWE